jgi:hypothetical protein
VIVGAFGAVVSIENPLVLQPDVFHTLSVLETVISLLPSGKTGVVIE